MRETCLFHTHSGRRKEIEAKARFGNHLCVLTEAAASRRLRQESRSLVRSTGIVLDYLWNFPQLQEDAWRTKWEKGVHSTTHPAKHSENHLVDTGLHVLSGLMLGTQRGA